MIRPSFCRACRRRAGLELNSELKIGIHSGRNGEKVGLPECRGKVGSPCSPAEAGACRTWGGLAAQPAQNVSSLNVLGTLDVLTHLADTDLELRFERERRSRQPSHSPMGDLAEHRVQFSPPLRSDFTSNQSAFWLKTSQGTPPLRLGKLNEVGRNLP